MGSGVVYHGFYDRAVIGAEVFEDDIFEATRQEVRDLAGMVVGESVIDPTSAGLIVTDDAAAINERKLTVGSSGTGLTTINEDGRITLAGDSTALLTFTDGARTPTVQDPAWWVDLPYENADTIVYRVYIGQTRYPIDVDIARGGTPRGYNRFVDAPGFTVNPDSIVDTTTELRLLIDGNLTALGMQRWLTANTEDNTWSYDCVVYLDTDVVGVEIATDDPDVAIALTAKLTKVTTGTGWVVDLTGLGDGYLGQAIPSLTAGDYKIAILGPLITTTDLDANSAWTHVATVTSAVGSETIDHTGQIIIRSVSDVVADVSVVPNRLHHKGWLTRPTLSTSGGGAILDFTVAEAFVGGTIVDTPVDALTSFTAASTLWVSWNNDPATAAYEFFATYDLANASNLVPIARIETDGGSLITQIDVIGRNIELYNETLFITVSDTGAHSPQFDNLKDALAFAAALRSSAVAVKDIVIDVIGDLTIADGDTISEPEFLGLKNVTIRGVGGNRMANGAGSAQAGARIIWGDVDDSLFELNDAGTVMEGWSFENITFRYTGTATGNDVAVVTCLAGGVESMSFVDCLVDGSGVLSGQGGANGSLPHAFFYDSATQPPRLIKFIRSNLYTRDAFYSNTGTAGTVGLTVHDCRATGPGLAPAFTEGGFVIDAFTTGGAAAVSWNVRGNVATILNGPAIQATKLKGLFCHDNSFSIEEDTEAIDLGNVTTGDDVEDVFIHDNEILREGTTGAISIVNIRTADPPTGSANIKLHDNIIDGVTSFTGLVGITCNGSVAAGAHGLNVSNNVVRNVDTGISCSTWVNPVIAFNQVEAVVLGITAVGDNAAGLSTLMLAMNVIDLSGTDPVGIELPATSSSRYAVHGNMINAADATTTTGTTGIDATDTDLALSIISGNLIHDVDVGIDSALDGGIISGNLIFVNSAGDCIDQASMSESVVLGNLLDGSGAGRPIASTALTAMGTSVIVGNLAGQGLTGATELLLATQVVITGNNFQDMDFGGTSDLVITGNHLGALAATFNSAFPDGMVVAGNDMTSWTDNSASSQLVFSGNNVTPGAVTTTFTVDDGTIGSSRFQDALTLSAATTNLAAVGNRAGGAVTDSGTGNTVASNDV